MIMPKSIGIISAVSICVFIGVLSFTGPSIIYFFNNLDDENAAMAYNYGYDLGMNEFEYGITPHIQNCSEAYQKAYYEGYNEAEASYNAGYEAGRIDFNLNKSDSHDKYWHTSHKHLWKIGYDDGYKFSQEDNTNV
jgi:hypothetical protein